MTSAACIGNGCRDVWGVGAVSGRKVVTNKVATMISWLHYHPNLSHYECFVAVAATKGVGLGSFRFVTFSWVGSGVTFVGDSDIPTMCPAVVVVIVVTDSSSGALGVVVVWRSRRCMVNSAVG